MSAPAETIHATCVAIPTDGEDRAVLIEGRSGAGKSDLALRLIDRGAKLVSDDYTCLRVAGGRLIATAPERIAGRIEVRGIGIVDWPHLAEAEVGLLISLSDTIERMPEAPAERSVAGHTLPAVALAPLEGSAAIKAEIATRLFWRGGAGAR